MGAASTNASGIVLISLTGWDKGGADLIASGAIKMKTCVSPVSYTERGVVFSDDTELPADVVIFA